MARIFLEQNELIRIGGNGHTLFGRAGGDPGEGVLVEDGGTDLATDAEIERLDIRFELAALTFQVTRNGLEISANGETIVTIPSLNQDLDLRTADGNVTLTQTGAQAFTAANPTDDTDTATIGTDPITPEIGTGNQVSETAVVANTVSVSDNGPVAEGETAAFDLRLTDPAEQDVSVDYAITRGGATADDHGTPQIDGADASLSGTIALSAGEAVRTIEIPVKEDAESPEDGETLSVTLSNLRGPDGVALGSASTTAEITNIPLSFALTQVGDDPREGERVTYAVTGSAPVAAETPVAFKVVPGDPNAPDQGTNQTNLNDFPQGAFNPSTTTIAAGETSTTFTVNTQSGDRTELPEDFQVEAEIDGSTKSVTTTLLDGTDGTDRLFALTGGADAVNAVLKPGGAETRIAPTLESVETIALTATDGNESSSNTVTFDGTNATGIDVVRFEAFGESGGATETDTVRVANVDQDALVAFKNATTESGGAEAIAEFTDTSGDGDRATIELYESDLLVSGGTSGGLTVNGVEDLTLDVQGDSGSTIEELKADAATTLTIAGSQDLTIAGDLANNAARLATINATAPAHLSTGDLGQALSVTAGDGDDTLDARGSSENVTADLGGGDDTFNLGNANDSVNAGAGDDDIVLEGEFDRSDSIDGGDGADIIIDSGSAISGIEGSDDKLAELRNIDGVGITNATSTLDGNAVDLAAFGDAGDRFVVDTAGSGNIDTPTTISGLDAQSRVTTTSTASFGGNTLTLSVPGARAVGSRDDAVTFQHGASDANVGSGVANLGLAGINTLNVVSNDDDPDDGDGLNLKLNREQNLNTITIEGAGDTTLKAANAANLAALRTIDAGASSGAVDIDLGGGNFGGTEGVAVVGGANDDTITGTPSADRITTGDGADTVIYDRAAFGAADHIPDFDRGDDELLIDLSTITGMSPSFSNNLINRSTSPQAGAGSFPISPTRFFAYTTGSSTTDVLINRGINIDTTTTVGTLTDSVVFTAASFSALQSDVAAAIAANSNDSLNVGIAVGVTSDAGRLVLFRVSDTQPFTMSMGTTTITNTIATIGSGTIAADDIAIF